MVLGSTMRAFREGFQAGCLWGFLVSSLFWLFAPSHVGFFAIFSVFLPVGLAIYATLAILISFLSSEKFAVIRQRIGLSRH